MIKYIIIICLFLNGCTAYKHNQLQKEIIKKQQSWLNIQYLAMKKPQLTNKKGTMTNKLQNKIDELIKLEELHNIKEQYKQHEKTKGLYEQIDFKPLPQEIMDNANTDWETNDQLKFLLLSHGFIFNDSINNNNITRGIND